MVNSRLKWYCPYCSQTSSRHGNLKVHIKRKHQGIGEPVREDKWHYTRATTSSTPAHFIPDIMSWQNNNNYHLNQRYPQTFSSASPYFKKEEDTSKKRDVLDEFLECWRPSYQKWKEILEIIKTCNEFSSFFSSSQQPNIITSLGQAPIIRPIIPPVITTTPLQQTPQSTQSSQEQEQKKENINPPTAFANFFYTLTLMAEDLQRRIREVGKGEGSIIQQPSLSPYMMTTISDDNNNNNSKKREANRITENTKQKKELGEDRHYMVGQPLSKLNLLMGNSEDGDIDGDRYVWGADGDFYFPGGKWRIKRDSQGNIIDACKIITDPRISAKNITLNEEEKAGKKLEQNEIVNE